MVAESGRKICLFKECELFMKRFNRFRVICQRSFQLGLNQFSQAFGFQHPGPGAHAHDPLTDFFEPGHAKDDFHL